MYTNRSIGICLLSIFVSIYFLKSSEAFTAAKFREMCQDLENHDLRSFMNKSLESVDWVCSSMVGASEMSYRNLYNDILAHSFSQYNEDRSKLFYVGTKPKLEAKNNNTFFILEFKVNKRAADAFAEIEKYVKSYHHQKRDILCLGINFHYLKGGKEVKQDTIKCDWVAKLYSEFGVEKKSFEQEELELACLW